MQFFTIGVYNSTQQEYFKKLRENSIDTFCDIRRHRGVRGAKYAFVNSKRLQIKLNELDIQYEHIIDLAPTAEVRDIQKEADAAGEALKRDRNKLGKAFIIAYKDRVLNKFDFDGFIERLYEDGSNRAALFCVEERPEACHRSIVANELAQQGHKITHL